MFQNNLTLNAVQEGPTLATYLQSSTVIDRVNKRGAACVSDLELLSAFFDISIEAARKMLPLGMRQILKGDQRLTQQQSARAKIANELFSRNLRNSMEHGDPMEDPDTVRDYLTARLRDREAEVFACVFLDNRHRVIQYEELFFGTIDGAAVHPREVVRAALKHNAAAVILAHNHPSGVAEPSQSDERITQRLQEALALVDVRILDHFVIGDQIVSFVERGLL